MSPKGILEDLIEIVGICQPHSFPDIAEGTCYTQLAVDELLELPPAKPDIEQLVNVHVNVEITRTKVIPTPVGWKAIIRGVVKQKIVYVADVPEQSLHAAHFEKPFCTFISMPKDEKEDDWEKEDCSEGRGEPEKVQAKVVIEDVMVQEFNKRSIHKCVLLLSGCSPSESWLRPFCFKQWWEFYRNFANILPCGTGMEVCCVE